MTKETDYSPMMNRYIETKKQYTDCILLYRLGDFYEMFFDDALEASKILDITLTAKNCGKKLEKAPMCGIPHHAVDSYLAKLIAAGKKVAICEQLEKPGESQNKILERGVVRIITPGTAIENDILKTNKNNFLMALCKNGNNVGIAYCDISTGEFETYQTNISKNNDLEEVILSVSPAEIICNSEGLHLNSSLKSIITRNVPKMNAYYDWTFAHSRAQEAIFKQYCIASLKGFGLEKIQEATCACGAIIEYLKETQKRTLPHLKPIKILQSKDYMTIDANARKNLELFTNTADNTRYGSLIWLLDKTKTAMGARKLNAWINRPLQNSTSIKYRLDAVEELYKDFILRETLLEYLSEISDLERLCSKLVYKTISPRDLVSIKNSLKQIPKIINTLSRTKSRFLQAIIPEIVIFDEIVELISRALKEQNLPNTSKDGGFINDGFNPKLDELRDIASNSLAYVTKLKEKEIKRTGIKTLKINSNRVFGFYYEVLNTYKDLVPADYIRKQSVINAERYSNEELASLEEKISTAKESAIILESAIFDEICMAVEKHITQIQQTSNAIATLDALLSFAKISIQNNYCKPKINTTDLSLEIKDGRHPIVEKFTKNNSFVPNDIHLNTQDRRTMIITGPNMAGKSTYMRQTALIVFMAHLGCFVPASSATIPIVDKIFTRVGASDEISFNHSTFMVEMSEVSYILNNATEKSLIILDEVGRGTATFDGLSIAWAIMEHITNNLKSKTLFATHYHELTELEGKIDGIINYNVAIKEINNSIVFLHKILPGGANKSFGIEVAQLAGISAEITDKARSILKKLEKTNVNKNVFNPIQIKADEEKKQEQAKKFEQICKEIMALDINSISPLIAFDILCNFYKHLTKED